MNNDASFLENMYLKLNDYLFNIDSNFFDELNTLLDTCKKRVHNPTSYDEMMEQLSIDEGLKSEELIELIKDFFHSLGSSYEKKFEDIISNNRIILSSGKSVEDSDESEMSLTGNYTDVVSLAHESEHIFSESEDNISIINALLCEVDAMVVEMLAIDYLKEKKNVNKYMVYDAREIDLIESDFFSSRYIEAAINLFNNIKNENTNFNNNALESAKIIYPSDYYRDEFEILFKGIMYTILSGFAHQIGYIVANYIHEKILENPKNIYMFEAVTQALTEKDEEKQIDILSQSGIPIIKDRKISLSGESIEVLVNYIDKSNRRRNLKDTQTLIKESIDGLPTFSILSDIENVQEKQTLNEKPKYMGDN